MKRLPFVRRRNSNTTRQYRAVAGFTLMETLVVVSIAGVLSSIAYPSLQAQVQKIRRAEALVTMMKVQLAQERWRANSASYGTLAQIGVPASTSSGAYTLQISGQSADGYQLLATATGTQARDAACRYMQITGSGGGTIQASGPDLDVANPDVVNRRCWNQ